MLKLFEVDNFRGFDAPTSIDFQAGSYAFNEAVVKSGVVKNAIIYGRNGVGKSALGIALFDIVSHLTDKKTIGRPYLNPYCNLTTNRESARFRYVFAFDGNEVEYEYAKTDLTELSWEKLFVNGERLIDFNFQSGGERYIKPDLVGSLNIELEDNKLSIIKYIYRNTPTDTVPIIRKLVEFCNGMLWYRSLSDGNDYAGFLTGSDNIDERIYARGKVKEFEQFLKENGLDYTLGFVERDGKHVMTVDFGGGRSAAFDAVASTGTKTLSLFFYWKITAFEKLSLLFIDEFDAFLHFESAASIVRILNTTTTCQTILTSHNTSLMNNELTRPDCCYVMTRNKVTPLCRATNRILREGHNLSKLYVNGAFAES